VTVHRSAGGAALRALIGLLPLALLASSCAGADSRADPPRAEWSIAIHGGAGTIPRDAREEEADAYRRSLAAALELGSELLASGGSSLDAVEAVVRLLEDDPLFNAGRGAVFHAEGGHELDASIMSGRDLSCGAVAAVRTVRHPITLARRVMEETRHVLLVGDGAEKFADTRPEIERVENSWFDTEHRRTQWLERRRAAEGTSATAPAHRFGTVGAVALDRSGHLAAATSTGGLTNKRFGRVGDSPIIGAGTYADDRTCAVSCTGTGEEFIRFGVARSISARMAYGGEDLETAARAVVEGDLAPDDGGIIAVDSRGRGVWVFTTGGMYRAAADSHGRREVRIWGDGE